MSMPYSFIGQELSLSESMKWNVPWKSGWPFGNVEMVEGVWSENDSAHIIVDGCFEFVSSFIFEYMPIYV